MAPWVRKCFVDVLPKYLFIKRPEKEEDDDDDDLMMMYDDVKPLRTVGMADTLDSGSLKVRS